jgi:hypothetical protein
MGSYKGWFLGALIGLCFSAALPAAEGQPQAARLSAAQVIDKHVAARGGLQAWHRVQSMSWNGKMDVGYGDSAARAARYVSNAALAHSPTKRELAALQAQAKPDSAKQVQLPFLLEMKRPNKSRVEVEFAGKTAVQVYDGAKGWMMRPYLNRDDWEPFSPEQAKTQADKWGLEDPLVDYAAKGTKVELETTEPVEGRAAYKLKLTLKNGDVQHVWIDAQSFLDVKVDGAPRRMDGHVRSVWVYQRDFRSVEGLMIPFVLESAIDGYRDTHKMVIEKVAVNPKLDDSRFVRPQA